MAICKASIATGSILPENAAVPAVIQLKPVKVSRLYMKFQKDKYVWKNFKNSIIKLTAETG